MCDVLGTCTTMTRACHDDSKRVHGGAVADVRRTMNGRCTHLQRTPMAAAPQRLIVVLACCPVQPKKTHVWHGTTGGGRYGACILLAHRESRVQRTRRRQILRTDESLVEGSCYSGKFALDRWSRTELCPEASRALSGAWLKGRRLVDGGGIHAGRPIGNPIGEWGERLCAYLLLAGHVSRAPPLRHGDVEDAVWSEEGPAPPIDGCMKNAQYMRRGPGFAVRARVMVAGNGKDDGASMNTLARRRARIQ